MHTYHVGLLDNNGVCVLQLKEERDCLSPDLIEYMGEYYTTPEYIMNNKDSILHSLNQFHARTWSRLEVWTD